MYMICSVIGTLLPKASQLKSLQGSNNYKCPGEWAFWKLQNFSGIPTGPTYTVPLWGVPHLLPYGGSTAEDQKHLLFGCGSTDMLFVLVTVRECSILEDHSHLSRLRQDNRRIWFTHLDVEEFQSTYILMIFIKSLLCQLDEAVVSANESDLEGSLQAALIPLQSDFLLSLEVGLPEEVYPHSFGDLHRFYEEMFQLVRYIWELTTYIETPTLEITLLIGQETQMLKIWIRF